MERSGSKRRRGRCDGHGPGRAGPRDRGGENGVLAETAQRAAVVAGAFVVQDVRDRDGLTRPMLRRFALHLVSSGRPALRGLGETYLRCDPPTADGLPSGGAPTAWPANPLAPAGEVREPVIDVDPATAVEEDDPVV